MRGRRPIATAAEQAEVFRLSDEGKSLRETAELVFGSRGTKDRVRRLLARRDEHRRVAQLLAQHDRDPDALLAEILAEIEPALELDALLRDHAA
jgi:hypothetical protein